MKKIEIYALDALHALSLRITDFGVWVSGTGQHLGERLWEAGGALECWCDEKAWELGGRAEEVNPVSGFGVSKSSFDEEDDDEEDDDDLPESTLSYHDALRLALDALERSYTHKEIAPYMVQRVRAILTDMGVDLNAVMDMAVFDVACDQMHAERRGEVI